MHEIEIRDAGELFAGETAASVYLQMGSARRGVLMLEGGQEIPVSEGMLEMLDFILEQCAAGRSVRVVAEEHMISPEKAASMLYVSRPFFYQLLDEGVLPWVQVGAHRRVFVKDVLEYERTRVRRGKKSEAPPIVVGDAVIDVAARAGGSAGGRSESRAEDRPGEKVLKARADKTPVPRPRSGDPGVEATPQRSAPRKSSKAKVKEFLEDELFLEF